MVKALSLVFAKESILVKTGIQRCAATRYTAQQVLFLETMERIQRLFVSIGVDEQKPLKTSSRFWSVARAASVWGDSFGNFTLGVIHFESNLNGGQQVLVAESRGQYLHSTGIHSPDYRDDRNLNIRPG